MYEIFIQRKRTDIPDVTVKKSSDIVPILLKLFPEEDGIRETCRAVMLDAAHSTIGHYLVSTGSADRVIIDIRGICTAAVASGARAVVICHNHPSGNPRPGVADLEQTDRLRKALATLDIQFLDHIILGEKTYFSFCDEVEAKYPRKIA